MKTAAAGVAPRLDRIARVCLLVALAASCESPQRPAPATRTQPVSRGDQAPRKPTRREPIAAWTAVLDGTPYLAAVATGRDGSSWVAGSFQSEIALGDVRERSGAADHRLRMVVLRFDRDGHLSWMVQAGGDHEGELHDVAVRRDGSAVVVGTFTGTFAWPGFGRPTKATSARAVIAALDAQGKLLWSVERPGIARAVAVHADDSVTVAGADVGGGNGFVVRFAPDGTVVWERAIAAAGIEPAGIAAVGDRAVVVGWFEATARFGDREVTAYSAGSRLAANPRDAFVASYGGDGKLEWIQHGGGPMFCQATDVVALDAGAVAVVGHAMGEMEIGRFRIDPGRWVGHGQNLFLLRVSGAGKVEWVASAAGAVGTAVAATDTGDLIVGGGAADGARFGDDAKPFATSLMPYEPVLALYRASGALVSVRQLTPEHSGTVDAVAADPAGRLAIAYSGSKEVLGRNPNSVQMRSPAGVDSYAVLSGFVGVAGSIGELRRPHASSP